MIGMGELASRAERVVEAGYAIINYTLYVRHNATATLVSIDRLKLCVQIARIVAENAQEHCDWLHCMAAADLAFDNDEYTRAMAAAKSAKAIVDAMLLW